MTAFPEPRTPPLAQRAAELRAFGWLGASISLRRGRELVYRFQVSPSAFGRNYNCVLRMKPDSRTPTMIVLQPDLFALANGRRPPHVYPHAAPGTKLCLWWPKRREWLPQMKITETYLPWTAEWLWYFEDWLTTDNWAGSGEHPWPSARRWQSMQQQSSRLRVALPPPAGDASATSHAQNH